MNLNNDCCCGCNTKVTDMAKANKCPVCNSEGISVGKVTVEHLVAESHRKDIAGDCYKICMTSPLESIELIFSFSKKTGMFLSLS